MFFLEKNSSTNNLGGGVSRKILAYNKEIMSVKVDFEAGAVGAVHTHPHSQISYCLAGKFKAIIDDKEEIISVGDTYYTEPNQPHGVVCLEKGALLDIFTPMREDFLK